MQKIPILVLELRNPTKMRLVRGSAMESMGSNGFRKWGPIGSIGPHEIPLDPIKSINKGPPGLKNPEIMEMLGSGPSHNKTKILLDQNWSK